MELALLPQKTNSNGFSLIQLLAVLAILTVILTMAVPILGVKGSSDLSKAAYDLQGALQVARNYAVTHNTYTWVGYFEEDFASAGKTPAASGIGKVIISIVASKDGSSIYDRTDAFTSLSTPATQTLDPFRLVQIGKLIVLQHVHVLNPPVSTDGFGKRPGSLIVKADRVGFGEAGDPLLFQFQYPLFGNAQYVFGSRGGGAPSGIVQFNPQGEAISETGPVPGVVPVKEIALQATRGNIPDKGVNIAAISISGISGQTTIYRR